MPARIVICSLLLALLSLAISPAPPQAASAACATVARETGTVLQRAGSAPTVVSVQIASLGDGSGRGGITMLQVTRSVNATIVVGGLPQAVPSTVRFPTPVTSWSFEMRRINPSLPMTMFYTMTDGCGTIDRFYGVGLNVAPPATSEPVSAPTSTQPVPTTTATPTASSSATPSMTSTLVTSTPSATLTPTLATGTATPTATPLTPTPSPAPAATFFPLGMFEDNNIPAGDTARFAAMIDDLRAHGLDSVLFTNSSVQYHAPLLDVSDAKGFATIFAPMHELHDQFIDNASVPATIDAARQLIYPLVNVLKSHPSLRGYNLRDDATMADATKLSLAMQAFREADPSHASTLVIPMGQEQVYTTLQPDTFLTYYYPAKAIRQPCDWGFTSPTLNLFSQTIRSVTRDRDPQEPLWLLLQSHGKVASYDPSANTNDLRVPTREEIRLQQWMALGEGARGTFWFIYSTQGWWTGLDDNQPLYDEVGAVTHRVAPLRSVLGNLHKTDDLFSVAGSGNRYVSTLADPNGKLYLIAANGSCSATQSLSVTSSSISAQVRDVETNQIYDMNAPISFLPGDGKLLEVVNIQGPAPTPTPAAKPNLVQNGSFEQTSGGQLTGWGGAGPMVRDTTVYHSGSASARIQGPQAFTYRNQSPALRPGVLHTISYWIKTSNVAGTGVTWRWVNLTPTFGLSNGQVTTGTSDWQQVTSTFFTAVDLATGRLDLTWALTGGTAWIDDVVLCEGRVCQP
ncbi:MAG: hypothetical protein U0893_08455 [Chloroflexota bacterium]